MPNWVFCTLTIKGEENKIAAIKTKLAQPVTTHFPKTEYDQEKQEWVSTPDTQVRESIISFYNIVSPTDTQAYYEPEVSSPKGKAYDATKVMEEFALSIQKKNNWYYWNLREWGCKWDAGEPHLNEQVTNDTTLCYQFETPWSPPLEVVEKLAQQHPDVTINIEFEEEQGWGGVMLWHDGKVTILDEWDIPDTHADNIKRRKSCWRCEDFDGGQIEATDLYEDCPNHPDNGKSDEYEEEN